MRHNAGHSTVDGTCDYVLLSIHVSSKFKILEVSNRRCLQHRVSETILNLVNEANVEGYLSQSSLSTLF